MAADILSRTKVVGQIWTHYGEAQIDFYASSEATHCQEWYSLIDTGGLLWPRCSQNLKNGQQDCCMLFPLFRWFLKSFRGSGRVITLCWWWLHAGQEGHGSRPDSTDTGLPMAAASSSGSSVTDRRTDLASKPNCGYGLCRVCLSTFRWHTRHRAMLESHLFAPITL